MEGSGEILDAGSKIRAAGGPSGTVRGCLDHPSARFRYHPAGLEVVSITGGLIH